MKTGIDKITFDIFDGGLDLTRVKYFPWLHEKIHSVMHRHFGYAGCRFLKNNWLYSLWGSYRVRDESIFDAFADAVAKEEDRLAFDDIGKDHTR